MTDDDQKSSVVGSLEAALALLRGLDPPVARQVTPDLLPSLLQQCEALTGANPVDCVRTVHHFAATGGSLLSKFISAQPNVVLLSEIDPLSRIALSKAKPAFSPRSVIDQLRYTVRGNHEDLIVEVFQAEINALVAGLARRGQVLVLRDHAHSQYCVGPDVGQRPSLRAIVMAMLPVRSVVTVRHPLESYLSILQRDWVNLAPATLEEYSRRYGRFLDDHAGVAIYRYEDFLAAPEPTLAGMCRSLDLSFDPGAMELHDLFAVSGIDQSAPSGPVAFCV